MTNMAASIHAPLLAVRGSEGLTLKNGPPCNKLSGIEGVTVLRTSDGAVLQKIDKPRTSCLRFSPKGTYLVTWENFVVVKDEVTPPNLNFWQVGIDECVKSSTQKQMQKWFPQFTNDEALLGKWVNNEMQFFSDADFDRFKAKLRIDKMMDVCVATAGPPYHVAAFVKGSKGQPSFVRIYRHPDYNTPLSNKSFYKADRVSLFWNPTGQHLLVLTAVDSSSESYYGDQGLQFLSVDGTSNAVCLGKNGPVYHVEWSPKQPEFVVVYGFMPAKTTLFNAKCEPLFDFGTGPWNLAHYNTHGSILCICGFGNLRGRMDMWDVRQRKQISTITAPDTTLFQWCPDGEHMVTATTAPRLRVGNGMKIWHYTGSLLHEEHTPLGQELWEVLFQPGKFTERPIQYSAVPTNLVAPSKPAVAVLADSIPAVYRPPGARGKPRPPPLHTYEKPSDLSQQSDASANLSKAALKNKKKREAKARARQEGQEDDVTAPEPHLAKSVPPPRQITPSDEHVKKIRNVEKKLQQIDKLKQQQKEGKPLEINQLDKLKSEESLRKELNDLKL